MSEFNQFAEDMYAVGIPVEPYHGRFMWYGPAVRSHEMYGPTLQFIIRATTVKVQWDNLGMHYIVYPIDSDRRWYIEHTSGLDYAES